MNYTVKLIERTKSEAKVYLQGPGVPGSNPWILIGGIVCNPPEDGNFFLLEDYYKIKESAIKILKEMRAGCNLDPIA